MNIVFLIVLQEEGITGLRPIELYNKIPVKYRQNGTRFGDFLVQDLHKVIYQKSGVHLCQLLTYTPGAHCQLAGKRDHHLWY